MEKRYGFGTERKRKARLKARRSGKQFMALTRRAFLAALILLLLALNVAAADRPILFVHGNGDTAALWYTTIWRFESNGYDPSLLFAIDFPHPRARSDDTKPQDNRSSTADQLKELSAKISEIQSRTGQKQLALVGSSRGGYPIRNYIKNSPGGAANVSHAVLCGTPNHGISANPTNLDDEFNGSGKFLSGLNSGDEVHPGVKFMTIRSDSNDKYAQPDGRFIGMPGQTDERHLRLAGAPGRAERRASRPRPSRGCFPSPCFQDHVRIHHRPRTGDDRHHLRSIVRFLNGFVSGWANGAPTNLPLAGATVEIFEVDPASGRRLGEAVHRRTTSTDGVWGLFTAKPTAYYEFVVSADGYPTTHIYRTPFPRSSAYIHLRLRPLADSEKGTGSMVTLLRPRGYLGARPRYVPDRRQSSGWS